MTEAAPNGTTFLVSGPASTVSGYAKAIVARKSPVDLPALSQRRASRRAIVTA